MRWNWELADWPKFHYEPERILSFERQFLLGMGSTIAYLKTVDQNEYNHFIIEILSMEGLESARIEGEILDRASLQSSIKRNFGLGGQKVHDKESRMANLLCNVYESFEKPLTHEMLWQWHSILFTNNEGYRTHPEPMQIVSNRYDELKVFFEAPPSDKVFDEMTGFIDWFNRTNTSEAILGRAAIAHVYFESIHPFEDGNGRIGRILVEKILSQGVGRPVLVAISQRLEKRKKLYYEELGKCNRTLEIGDWVEFFSSTIVEAHEESMRLLYFLIQKSKMMGALAEQINPRQTKVLLRMFAEGPDGFQGGLSAEKYISITKATRATATRDLTDLVEKGALIKEGELRHTRYRLNV